MRLFCLFGKAKEQFLSLIDDLLRSRFLLLTVPALCHLVGALLAFQLCPFLVRECLYLFFKFLYEVLLLVTRRFF
jgi:hypothetical protein